jgi:hypothetical protein
MGHSFIPVSASQEAEARVSGVIDDQQDVRAEAASSGDEEARAKAGATPSPPPGQAGQAGVGSPAAALAAGCGLLGF